MQWRKISTYIKPDDWVFASKRYQGRRPYWGQAILRKYIRPVAQRVGIQKRFGWHTFRQTYSTLLQSAGTEFKVMQELLRHSSLRSTLGLHAGSHAGEARRAGRRAVAGIFFRCEPRIILCRIGNHCQIATTKGCGKGQKKAQKGRQTCLFVPLMVLVNFA
jgi:Phage integrase family